MAAPGSGGGIDDCSSGHPPVYGLRHHRRAAGRGGFVCGLGADDRVCHSLRHDDSEREYAYNVGAEKAQKTASERGWNVISMKNDFKKVFPF